MNKTLSFTYLDFITVKPYFSFKNIIIFLFLGIFFGITMDSPVTIVGVFMMWAAIYSSYPFAAGEKNSVDTLYATLAVSRKNIVAGRYVFAACLNVIMGIFSIILTLVLFTILNKEVALFEIFVSVLACFMIFSILESVQLPFYFKLGYTKAKFFTFLPLAFFYALIVLLSTLFKDIDPNGTINSIFGFFEKYPALILAVMVFVGLLALFISHFISYSIYNKRDL